MSVEKIVIVGAGQAGLQVAETLRRKEFDGSVTLIGDESELLGKRRTLIGQFNSGISQGSTNPSVAM
ncbi:MAG: FAD-dependent oxidoreductase, partial [Pseudomonadota bacterium]